MSTSFVVMNLYGSSNLQDVYLFVKSCYSMNINSIASQVPLIESALNSDLFTILSIAKVIIVVLIVNLNPPLLYYSTDSICKDLGYQKIPFLKEKCRE